VRAISASDVLGLCHRGLSGCRVDCTFDSRQQTTSEMVSRHPPMPENTNSGIVFSHEEMTPTLVEVESCFHERVVRVNSNLQRTTPDGKSECQTKTIVVNGSANASAGENADERRGGKARKKSSSRGRNSYDSDSLTGDSLPVHKTFLILT